MSTNETLAVGATANGTVVFYNPRTSPDVRRLGAGPVDSDLDDLTPFVQIPQLGEFARELLGTGQEAAEVQP